MPEKNSGHRQTLAKRIEEQLERAIARGEYAPGTRLNELELSDTFGASRSPVREAIQRLANKGVVYLEAGRGAFVAQPDVTRILQLFEALSAVEATCARLAARRITASELQELEALHMNYSNTAQMDDAASYYNESVAFHVLITRFAKNQFLEAFAADLSASLKPYRLRTLEFPQRIKNSVSEHRRVLDALKNGDENEAEAAMRAHSGFVSDSAMDMLQIFSHVK